MSQPMPLPSGGQARAGQTPQTGRGKAAVQRPAPGCQCVVWTETRSVICVLYMIAWSSTAPSAGKAIFYQKPPVVKRRFRRSFFCRFGHRIVFIYEGANRRQTRAFPSHNNGEPTSTTPGLHGASSLSRGRGEDRSVADSRLFHSISNQSRSSRCGSRHAGRSGPVFGEPHFHSAGKVGPGEQTRISQTNRSRAIRSDPLSWRNVFVRCPPALAQSPPPSLSGQSAVDYLQPLCSVIDSGVVSSRISAPGKGSQSSSGMVVQVFPAGVLPAGGF